MAVKYATLQEQYIKKYKAELKVDLNKKSIMQVPELKKIVLNVGAGIAVQNPKIVDSFVEELGLITGQAAVKTKAKKSISTFKLRDGMVIGTKVTLRGKRMYEFLDKLINVALPRVRDFNGYSRKSFDKFGNYSLGIKEQIIFTEIDFDKVDKIHGFDITFVIRGEGKKDSEALLEKFGFPFRKK